MRLFVAIDFSQKEKMLFTENAALLKSKGVTGNFLRSDNYHITLAFLGEVDRTRLSEVKNALNSVEFSPVSVFVGGVSRLGDVLVQKVDQSPELEKLALNVRKALDEKGIYYDRKPFKAHMTMAREVRIPNGLRFDDLSKELKTCSARKDEIILFESTRIDGKLVYRKVYSKSASVK